MFFSIPLFALVATYIYEYYCKWRLPGSCNGLALASFYAHGSLMGHWFVAWPLMSWFTTWYLKKKKKKCKKEKNEKKKKPLSTRGLAPSLCFGLHVMEQIMSLPVLPLRSRCNHFEIWNESLRVIYLKQMFRLFKKYCAASPPVLQIYLVTACYWEPRNRCVSRLVHEHAAANVCTCTGWRQREKMERAKEKRDSERVQRRYLSASDREDSPGGRSQPFSTENDTWLLWLLSSPVSLRPRTQACNKHWG